MRYNNIFKQIFLLPIFFPYIGFINGLDLQPFFLASFAIYIFLNFFIIKIEKTHLMVLIIFLLYVLSVTFYFQVPDLIDFLIMPVMFFIFLAIVLNNDLFSKHISSNFVLSIIFIYLIVGFIQLFIPEFLAGLVARGTDSLEILSSTNRGVRSLCAEPSQFARLITSLSVLYALCAKIEDKKIEKVTLTLVCIFLGSLFLSKALYSITMHILVLASFIFLTKNLKIKYKLLTSVVFLSFSALIFLFLQEYRISTLAFSIIENPSVVFNHGAISKLLNVYLSITGGLSGIFSFLNNSSGYITFASYDFYLQNKFHGGYVDLIYKFGIAGLIYIVIFFFQLFKKINNSIYSDFRFFIIFYFLLIPFSYGPLLNPFPLIIISMIQKRTNEY